MEAILNTFVTTLEVFVRKKYSVLKLVLFAILLSSISSCSLMVQRDVEQLESSVDTMRSFDSDIEYRLNSIDKELKELKGKVEVLQHANERLIEREVDTLKSDLTSLKKRVPPPGIVPANALNSAESTVNTLPNNVADSVRAALNYIREGSFNDAIPKLNTAFDMSVGKPFASEILFWSGVAYEGLEQFREALNSYNNIIVNHPSSPLVPASLSRQAGIFKKLGDMQAYSVSVRKLLKDFPKSEEAKLLSKTAQTESK